jgi:hypothetical protein
MLAVISQFGAMIPQCHACQQPAFHKSLLSHTWQCWLRSDKEFTARPHECLGRASPTSGVQWRWRVGWDAYLCTFTPSTSSSFCCSSCFSTRSCTRATQNCLCLIYVWLYQRKSSPGMHRMYHIKAHLQRQIAASHTVVAHMPQIWMHGNVGGLPQHMPVIVLRKTAMGAPSGHRHLC